MASLPQARSRGEILALVRCLPTGRVATFDMIGQFCKVTPQQVATVIAGLSPDEREIVPWHRVVAKGGAIGRGPHRDQQFAKLVREGVPMSPAGVVQDMARVCVALSGAGTSARAQNAETGVRVEPAATAPMSRSRGMKNRPI